MGKAVLARALMAGGSPLGQVTPPVLLGAGAWAGAGACISAEVDGAQVAESSMEKDFGFAGGSA